MKLNTFLVLSAVYYGGFGLGLLIAPAPFMSVFGVTLDGGGMLMARVLGAALLNLTLIFWWSRNAANSDTLHMILRANCLYNIADIPVIIFAIVTGSMGVLG
jgi:hypothetical protein